MTGLKTAGEVANINARAEMKPTSSTPRMIMLLLEVQGLGVPIEEATLAKFARIVAERARHAVVKDTADAD